MIDYHIHTAFSADSQMDIDLTITTAIKRGLTHIAITDHMDHEHYNPFIKFDLNIQEYSRVIDELKEKYKHQITIAKGVELGLQPYLLDWCRDFLDTNSFDFVIGSIHNVQKQDLYTKFTQNKCKHDCIQGYLLDLQECVTNFDGYSVVGHFDVIRRYIKDEDDEDNTINFEDYLDITTEIFKTLIHKGKGIEINTSGLRKGLGATSPSIEFVKRFCQLGGEILTIGSDAHIPTEIGQDLEAAVVIAKAAGFKYLTTFAQGKPEFHRI